MILAAWAGDLGALLLNAIQVLILTVLFQRVVVIFRSGRATPILTTLLSLAALYGLAVVMRMRAIVFLFETLAPFLGIMLVIIFQPEIRRALERAGPLRGLILAGNRGNQEETMALIEVLVKTLDDFAENRTGALIVLEQSSNLDSFIETGEPLDARLSHDLLVSIFDHHSPLHDGAVILRGARVIAARCFLNLSDNPELPPHYGTRHRAAVGLSELTDAIILVVSEESGRMSVVHQARIAEGLSRTALRFQLQTLLLPASGIASPLPDAGKVTHDSAIDGGLEGAVE